MRIKFLGVKGEVKKSGCPVCGKSIRYSYAPSYSKRIILPTGRIMIFIINHEYTVSEEEGQFLLKYHYELKGKGVYPFVQV